jgi:hypothetical protein
VITAEIAIVRAAVDALLSTGRADVDLDGHTVVLSYDKDSGSVKVGNALPTSDDGLAELLAAVRDRIWTARLESEMCG